MKYLQYISITTLAIILLSSLQSCSDDMETISELDIEVVLDTTIVESAVSLNSNGNIQSLQGIYASCSFDGIYYTNVLAYGTDLVIVDGEGEFKDDLFVQYWETYGPLVPGIYLTEGEIVTQESVTDPETFFEVNVEEVVDGIITRGRFRSVNLLDSDTFKDVSGQFETQAYDCAALDIGEGDFGEYITGRAVVLKDDNSSVIMAASGSCEDMLLLDQDKTINLVVMGGALELDGGGKLSIEEDDQVEMIIMDEQDAYDNGVQYSGVLITDFKAMNEYGNANGGLNSEDLLQFGIQIDVIYEIQGVKFTKGTAATKDGQIRIDFNATNFECQ